MRLRDYLQGTPWHPLEVETLRRRLFKIGARIQQSSRRIWINGDRPSTHTRAFRRWKQLLNPDQIQFAERSLWEKLQALDETVVRAKLNDFLKPAEINGLIERKGLLVDHIQKLIDDRGETAVLFTLR